jgi:hypothetical protein
MKADNTRTNNTTPVSTRAGVCKTKLAFLGKAVRWAIDEIEVWCEAP